MQAIVAEHRAAPERRVAQRAVADDVTTIVHGDDATRAAREAADVLFGGDPLAASTAALEALAGEVPSSRAPASALDDAVELLVRTGLGTSKSDARRQLQQGAVRANGVVLAPDATLTDVPRLHDRYVLLRKGKRTYHLVEIDPGS